MSAFDAELFRRLAQGEDVGRAVTLARQAVAQGTWWQRAAGANGRHGDPWAQWSLPVLLDRTQDGPLVDVDSKTEPLPPWSRPTVLIGDGTLYLPERQTFIGRRREMRQHLRAFLEGERRGLLFTGPGSMGKTTLAGLFARSLMERQPQTRLLGFRAPFALDMLYEPLRREAFDEPEEPSLLLAIQMETDPRERLRRLLQSLAQRRDRPCALVLDNLEALQELDSLTVSVAHEDSLWFLRAVCALLTPAQDHLLRAASLYRVPVNNDGLLAVAARPETCDADRQALLAYALLEQAYDTTLDLTYFVVPPIVRALLKQHGFAPEERQTLHRLMGHYQRSQGEHVSRRWSDDIEAIYHFRQAGEHTAADTMAEAVCSFYYRSSNYSAARDLTAEIVQRTVPGPPWWALNRHGLCQLRLGFLESALEVFQRALPLAPTRQDEGTTLNNLSQLFAARGDYDTALRYLEQSLAIQRDIGD